DGSDQQRGIGVARVENDFDFGVGSADAPQQAADVDVARCIVVGVVATAKFCYRFMTHSGQPDRVVRCKKERRLVAPSYDELWRRRDRIPKPPEDSPAHDQPLMSTNAAPEAGAPVSATSSVMALVVPL